MFCLGVVASFDGGMIILIQRLISFILINFYLSWTYRKMFMSPFTYVFSQETSKETESLKTQVAHLREKVRSLRDEIEEQELNHKEKEESLRKTITALEVSEK